MATERGIVIVNVTQCAVGRVSSTYSGGHALARAGVVAGGGQRGLSSHARAHQKLTFLHQT